ncbi:hypothetical protein DFJ73DRAFT_271988 [Zopfochytrium polystomum]|nr:hypothetical protein DFJ73DRAFT_271988 [Zopfochytrium polystomum]
MTWNHPLLDLNRAVAEEILLYLHPHDLSRLRGLLRYSDSTNNLAGAAGDEGVCGSHGDDPDRNQHGPTQTPLRHDSDRYAIWPNEPAMTSPYGALFGDVFAYRSCSHGNEESCGAQTSNDQTFPLPRQELGQDSPTWSMCVDDEPLLPSICAPPTRYAFIHRHLTRFLLNHRAESFHELPLPFNYGPTIAGINFHSLHPFYYLALVDLSAQETVANLHSQHRLSADQFQESQTVLRGVVFAIVSCIERDSEALRNKPLLLDEYSRWQQEFSSTRGALGTVLFTIVCDTFFRLIGTPAPRMFIANLCDNIACFLTESGIFFADACLRGQSHIVEELLREAKATPTDVHHSSHGVKRGPLQFSFSLSTEILLRSAIGCIRSSRLNLFLRIFGESLLDKSFERTTLLKTAINCKDPEIVKSILMRHNVQLQDSFLARTCFFDALNEPAVLRHLLKAKDCLTPGIDSLRILCQLVRKDQVDALKVFLEDGRVNPTENSCAAFAVALREGKTRCVRVFLDDGRVPAWFRLNAHMSDWRGLTKFTQTLDPNVKEWLVNECKVPRSYVQAQACDAKVLSTTALRRSESCSAFTTPPSTKISFVSSAPQSSTPSFFEDPVLRSSAAESWFPNAADLPFTPILRRIIVAFRPVLGDQQHSSARGRWLANRMVKHGADTNRLSTPTQIASRNTDFSNQLWTCVFTLASRHVCYHELLLNFAVEYAILMDTAIRAESRDPKDLASFQILSITQAHMKIHSAENWDETQILRANSPVPHHQSRALSSLFASRLHLAISELSPLPVPPVAALDVCAAIAASPETFPGTPHCNPAFHAALQAVLGLWPILMSAFADEIYVTWIVTPGVTSNASGAPGSPVSITEPHRQNSSSRQPPHSSGSAFCHFIPGVPGRSWPRETWKSPLSLQSVTCSSPPLDGDSNRTSWNRWATWLTDCGGLSRECREVGKLMQAIADRCQARCALLERLATGQSSAAGYSI